jgi:hypothetical protein
MIFFSRLKSDWYIFADIDTKTLQINSNIPLHSVTWPQSRGRFSQTLSLYLVFLCERSTNILSRSCQRFWIYHRYYFSMLIFYEMMFPGLVLLKTFRLGVVRCAVPGMLLLWNLSGTRGTDPVSAPFFLCWIWNFWPDPDPYHLRKKHRYLPVPVIIFYVKLF